MVPTVEDQAYLQGEEYAHLRQSICVLPTFVNSYRSEDEYLRHLHNTIVYRELVWSLASPILDRLESLTIPLSDIDRYLEVIDRLGRLERIEVTIDEVYEHGNLLVDEATRLCKEKAMRTLVRFVENHGRLFAGRLRAVNISDNYMWNKVYCTRIEDVQLQIDRQLPPMSPPAFLNKSNWTRLMTHPLTTNLKYVERINIKLERFSEPHYEDLLIFQRCRALRSLDITPVGKGSFKWAVREKESAGGESGDLVPLERLSIQSYHSLTDEVNDIAFAFSNTLQHIRIDDTVQDGPAPTIRIGQGWVDMPKLTHLTMHIRMNRLLLDPLLLAHCHSLVDVDLMDSTLSYLCSDIVPMLPAQLGQLSMLKLQGWPALTFDPATLHSTSKLVSVTICSTHNHASNCYIPPVDELEQSFAIQDGLVHGDVRAGKKAETEGMVQSGVGRRPPWSWDWVLPHLSFIELFGEFAYRFEFRMLRGCPSLVTLILKINTEQSTHTRVLTEDDFFVTIPAIAQPDPTSGRQRQQKSKIKRISAPALTSLHLQGPWVLDDSLVPMLFHSMFPILRSVVMPQCSGFSLQALVDCLRGKGKHLLQMSLGFPEPSLEKQRDLGLYPRLGRKKHNSVVYPLTIALQGVEYLLLRDVATSLAAPSVSPSPSTIDQSL
jgi:hypothetical protein